jgi:hypothetical protein|tara:strand:+ start:282 stop:461 length:180 start_codon:yes stop_codon:yes gene_type:complete
MNIPELIAQYLFSEETRETLVKELNKNINIPIIGEKTEEKIIRAIWGTIEEVFKKVLLK